MSTPSEYRLALQRLTEAAVGTSLDVLSKVGGSPQMQRAVLLEDIPAVVGYYAEGAGALAADFYEERREIAIPQSTFTAEVIVADRTVKLRRGVAWASQPLFAGDVGSASSRFAEVVQFEVAHPFRDTILANRSRDPEAVGWRRITAGGCKFCRMLADRGAVYKHDTARFAAHPSCHCTAEPVFKTDSGPEASVMQYVASKKNRTAQQRADLRDFLDAHY